MSEHEEHETETDEIEDLELAAEDAEQVTGGAVTFSDLNITKHIDKSSP